MAKKAKNQKIVAIIPARGGSKGIPKKTSNY
jgi:CMP-N-acetylneuraminic acid synthetase